MQTTRVTQIQVRVDCNGCVHKIRKALNGINGIRDLHVDLRRQKLTITGWAEPEKIVKAIKKTRKNATICTNIELPSQSQLTEPGPKGNAPEAPDAAATQQQPPEAQPARASIPAVQPLEETSPNSASQQKQSYSGRKGVREVHVIHHHIPDYVNRLSATSPIFVRHSYNEYMPSHYVTEYEYVRSTPSYTHYNSIDHYNADYPNGNGGITSMFSDDNPNACSIA